MMLGGDDVIPIRPRLKHEVNQPQPGCEKY
jgi:hypothetical protein